MLLTLVERLARFMAILGGLVLTALIGLTCVSVLGRGLNTFGHSEFLTSLSESAANALIATGVGPVSGDFELVEAGISFTIFAFLPICQLKRGHATVDVFAGSFPIWMNRGLEVLWEVLFSLLIFLITWRLFVGMEDKMRYNETTFLLQFPIWWASRSALPPLRLPPSWRSIVRLPRCLNCLPAGVSHPTPREGSIEPA